MDVDTQIHTIILWFQTRPAERHSAVRLSQ